MHTHEAPSPSESGSADTVYSPELDRPIDPVFSQEKDAAAQEIEYLYLELETPLPTPLITAPRVPVNGFLPNLRVSRNIPPRFCGRNGASG